MCGGVLISSVLCSGMTLGWLEIGHSLYHANQQVLKSQDLSSSGGQLLSIYQDTPGCNILPFEGPIAFHLCKCTYLLKFWTFNLRYKAFIVREMGRY